MESVKPGEGVEGTVLRIYAFGPLVIAREGLSEPIPKDRLTGRGAAPALGLLKALVSRSDRFALRDWLLEQFWPESPVTSASERLDDVASGLRTLLRPPGSAAKVLQYVYGSDGRGSGYRLEGYPVIWVDADAFDWYVEQAARYERFGQDALLLWERAFQLGSRGQFLAEEAYSDWARHRREILDGQFRQCVHRLSSLLRERGATELALLRLRTYWQAHPCDEDALRPLMELLGEQERYQEAESCYQRLSRELSEQGGQVSQPDERTRDLREYLCARQLQRARGQVTAAGGGGGTHAAPIQRFATPLGAVVSGERDVGRRDFEAEVSHLSFPCTLPLQQEEGVLSRLSAVLNQPAVCDAREIEYFDQQTRLFWRAREETILPAPVLYARVLKHLDDIQTLLMRSPSPLLRASLCESICRTVLLAGIMCYDVGQYEQARAHYQVAYQAAIEAHSEVLQGIVWGWMSFTWSYANAYAEALGCVQRARFFARQTSESMVQAWLGAIEAEIQSHLCDRAACLQCLTPMERVTGWALSPEISYLFEFTPVLLLGYKGVCLQQFYDQRVPETRRLLQEAKEALELALTSEAPAKRKLYYLSDLAGVYARQGEVEAACAYVEQSIPLIRQMGTGSKTIRSHLFRARSLLHPHEDSSYVRTLDEQIAPLLLEVRVPDGG